MAHDHFAHTGPCSLVSEFTAEHLTLSSGTSHTLTVRCARGNCSVAQRERVQTAVSSACSKELITETAASVAAAASRVKTIKSRPAERSDS